MANSLQNSYSDPRYGVVQQMTIPDTGATQTTTMASDTVIRRHTYMNAVRVTDWNAVVAVGATQTATAASARTYVEIGKSVAGTGAVSVLGSAFIGGTQANNTVVDSSLTATNFDSGDDLVLQYAASTGAAAGVVQAGGQVTFVERFT